MQHSKFKIRSHPGPVLADSRFKNGMVLIVSLIFLAVFAAWAVSISSMSGVNVQLAHNQGQANRARASAESGLDILRFWLDRVDMPGNTSPGDRINVVASSLQDDLIANDITNIYACYDGSTITIPAVMFDTSTGQSFSAVIQSIDADTVQLDVTGSSGQITRTIRTNFKLTAVNNPIFDFGLATKGAVHFNGNPTLTAADYDSEASIYIESASDNLALLVTGNTNFAGDVTIGNEAAYVDFQGDVAIGGETGQAARDNHVSIGAEAPDFPRPDTEHFRQYATGDIIDSSTDTTESMTLTNTVIEAGTNPLFEGNITVEGILFLESPNIVTFNGNVQIKGIIVGDGDVDDPGDNGITFLGNFESGEFPGEPQFDAMRDEAGSTLLAPGFSVSLLGNFASLGGVMAVSGAHFAGNVNAVIQGSIINYSDTPMVVEGNAALNFDRPDTTQVPAGFEPDIILEYDPGSYLEVVL